MNLKETALSLFKDGDLYHIETIPLICRANQWTGFYMIRTFVMEELKPYNLMMTLFSSLLRV